MSDFRLDLNSENRVVGVICTNPDEYIEHESDPSELDSRVADQAVDGYRAALKYPALRFFVSADALSVYLEKLPQARKTHAAVTNSLVRTEGMLTPEKVAELEEKKRKEDEAMARKEKAEAEFRAFEKGFDR